MNHLPLRAALWMTTALIAFSAWQLHNTLKPRVTQQQNNTATWAAWQNEATDLKPIQQQWESAIPTSGNLQDHLSVQQRLNMQRHHLTLDTSRFAVTSIDNYTTPDGKTPGLIRICFGTSASEPRLSLTTVTPEQAATALAELGNRADLMFSAARLSHEGGPTITLENPCLLTRA